MKASLMMAFCAAMLFSACTKKDDDNKDPDPVNNAKEQLNVTYGTHPYQVMDVYFPQGYTTSTPVAFLIHGGGFIAGLKEEFTMQAKLMRDEGFITVNISHRLVDTSGLFRNPPLRQVSAVKVSDEVADVAAAVQRYRDAATGWGAGAGKMYMAGHSAGAILAMLYVQGDKNKDGHMRVSGNWAGVTDLSIPADSAFNYLPEPSRSQLKELYYRATGFEAKTANNLAYMAISPYWVASLNGGKPNISIFPENNDVLKSPGEVAYNLKNTQNFHKLLRDRGQAEQLSVYAGSDHGFGTPADAWQRCIKETAAFFKAH